MVRFNVWHTQHSSILLTLSLFFLYVCTNFHLVFITFFVVDQQFVGAPSDVLVEGKINGVECVLLARHGRKHSIMPSNVNYRANIWALKNVGCTHIIVSTATGSLQEDIKPGEIVIIDNFIDRTTKRNQTFYDGRELSPFGVCHLPMEPAFCERSRDVIIQTACDLGKSVHMLIDGMVMMTWSRFILIVRFFVLI